MMRSEFVALNRQIRRLATTLLPCQNPTATYSQSEILRMLAFRLSAHAEIEAFVENCALYLANHYATLNGSDRLTPKCRRLLLHHSGMREQYPPLSLSSPLPSNTQKRVAGILNKQIDIIDGNNGVSQKDVLKLFVPLGIEISFFDISWLDSMDALARSRGEAAHTSWLDPNRDQPEPKEEKRRLAHPLWGLRSLIAEVERLKTQA